MSKIIKIKSKELFVILWIVILFAGEASAQWKQLDVGAPGKVNAVDIIGNDVFAGTNAGIFKSTDDGETWTNVNNAFTLCFATKGTEIFAGTMDEGVVVSTDGGDTWYSPDSNFTRMVRALAVKDSDIYAGGAGMFKSRNDGASWITIENGMQGYQSWVAGLAVGDNKLFATTENGLMVSTDGGESWVQVGGNGLSVETTNAWTYMIRRSYWEQQEALLGPRTGVPHGTRTTPVSQKFPGFIRLSCQLPSIHQCSLQGHPLVCSCPPTAVQLGRV